MDSIVESIHSQRDLKSTLRVFAQTVPVSRRIEYNLDLISEAALDALPQSSMVVKL